MRTDTRRALRAALADRSRWPLMAPGVYDVAGARIVEAAGLPAAVLSGYFVSACQLGRPDAGYLSLPEQVTIAAHIVRRSAVPLIVDTDTGFGNALGAMRTAEEVIGTGAAALFLEDQVFPKRCGHVAGKQVVTAEEFAGKLRAVDRVRRELAPDFIVIARTDARGVAGGSLEEAIRRGRLYRDAGADVIFVEALLDGEELARSAAEIGAPLLYNMAGRLGVSPNLPLADLRAAGVFLLAFPAFVFQAAMRAAWDALHRLQKDGPQYVSELEAGLEGHPIGDIHEFVGFPELRRLEEEYLPETELDARYQGSVGYRPAGKP
jgi:2-methylisocitrate lyase-like PEP mutase family enzyme